VKPGIYVEGPLTMTVREDPETRLVEVRCEWTEHGYNILRKRTKGARSAVFYFNGLGDRIEAGHRDGLAEFVKAMNIPATMLEPLRSAGPVQERDLQEGPPRAYDGPRG